jgi:CheY-like chemotaxis protein
MAKLLIIDDDDVIRDMMCEILGSAGYRVDDTDQGNTAIELMRQHHYDIVITDIFMPGKSGFEVISEFRREFPQIKIIAMTGSVTIDINNFSLKAAPGAEINGFIKKPFSCEELLQAVHAILGSTQK